MRRYFYRGRHRKPSKIRRRAAVAAMAGTVWGTLVQGNATAGPPGGWERIINCESGGDPKAKNPSSSASGLFQFIDSTWRAYGGSEFAPTAREATAEQQYIVAERAYADAGLRPWYASRSCWEGKVATGSSRTTTANGKTTTTGRQATARYYVVQPGDTLSSIARKFGVSGGWRTLHERNRSIIANPNLILPGQRLTVG